MPKGAVIKLKNLEVLSSPQYKSQPSVLSHLKYAEPTELYLRDGDVALFRRPNSPLWQCRFKRHDNTWDRVSTKQASIEHAVRVACDLYDEARFRQRLGLAQNQCSVLDLNFGRLLQANLRQQQLWDDDAPGIAKWPDSDLHIGPLVQEKKPNVITLK
jgi:hypothetical protein